MKVLDLSCVLGWTEAIYVWLQDETEQLPFTGSLQPAKLWVGHLPDVIKSNPPCQWVTGDPPSTMHEEMESQSG